MAGFKGRERRAPAQSPNRGWATIPGVCLLQTKAALEVASRVRFAAGFVEVVSVVPCGMVAARAEEERRMRPRNESWESICMAKEWLFGGTSVLGVESGNERWNETWKISGREAAFYQ